MSILDILRNAPEDDEPISEEETQAVKEGIKDLQDGGVKLISHDDLKFQAVIAALMSSPRCMHPAALQTAKLLLKEILPVLGVPNHSGVSREGDVTFTYCSKERLVSFECYSDDDVVWMLSDRVDDSSDTVVKMCTGFNLTHILAKSIKFLAGDTP